MSTRFDVLVCISSEKLTRLFLLKKVKPSHDRKIIKLIAFYFLLPTWNDQILSWLENGSGKAINFTISLRTRTLSPLFSSILTFLLSSKCVTWYMGGRKSFIGPDFSATFSLASPLSDRKVPNVSRIIPVELQLRTWCTREDRIF